MLRKRIIPIVLLDGFSVLKTIRFKERRNLGSPITVIRTYNTRNVDEIILLDIDASKQKRSIDHFTIKDIADECFMPLTVGGGIRSTEDIQKCLNVGADKIAINSFALENPQFICDAASMFGSQCIVVSIDVIEQGAECLIYSNEKILMNITLEAWVVQIEKLGAGEILINNVTRDGTMSGTNTQLAKHLCKLVSIPIVFAGGVASAEDAALVAETEVSGIGISSLFHFTSVTPEDCRNALKMKNIPAR